MAKHVIRPIPLYYIKNWPWYLETFLLDFGPTIKPLDIATYIWYIEGPNKNIIVDAGSTADFLNSVLGLTAPHSYCKHIQTVAEGLSRLGLKPDEIDIVILTQLHPDHSECARQFTKAKFVIQKSELDFALNPHPVMASLYPKQFFEGLNFEVIDGDREITKGVNVLYTPGHTAGCQSVVVDTAKGKAAITGFCCIRENLEPPEPLKGNVDVVVSGIHLGDTRTLYDNMLRLKKSVDILIPNHDVESVDKNRIP
jgi:glyoxylase-like metal-dependent hydrolase (beta-lactamase superfamily II)